MTFMYRGGRVFIPDPAEVPRSWRLSGESSREDTQVKQQVQEHLDRVSGRDLPVGLTLHANVLLDRVKLPCEVIPIEENARVVWGVHTKHTARRLGISPFVNADWARKLTEDVLSFEYRIQESGQLMITRMYPGAEYQPPLPWMRSVDDAPGGLEECIKYWRRHAFVLRSGSFKNPEVPRDTPPDWWKPMS